LNVLNFSNVRLLTRYLFVHRSSIHSLGMNAVTRESADSSVTSDVQEQTNATSLSFPSSISELSSVSRVQRDLIDGRREDDQGNDDSRLTSVLSDICVHRSKSYGNEFTWTFKVQR
jgi:hypothetical protein